MGSSAAATAAAITEKAAAAAAGVTGGGDAAADEGGSATRFLNKGKTKQTKAVPKENASEGEGAKVKDKSSPKFRAM
jgi:prephenate dehydratase